MTTPDWGLEPPESYVNRFEYEEELYEQEKRELASWEWGDIQHDLAMEEAEDEER